MQLQAALQLNRVNINSLISPRVFVWHVCQVKNDASVSSQDVILSASHAQSVLARLRASHAARHVRQTECTDDVRVYI